MTFSSSLASPSPAEAGRVTLTHHAIGHRTVLAVAGEVDLLTAPELRVALDAAWETGAMELWIDLTETEFMDSTGLHAIVDAHERARELQRRLAVICPPGGVRRVFDVAGLTDRIPVFDGRGAAQRSS